MPRLSVCALCLRDDVLLLAGHPNAKSQLWQAVGLTGRGWSPGPPARALACVASGALQLRGCLHGWPVWPPERQPGAGGRTACCRVAASGSGQVPPHERPFVWQVVQHRLEAFSVAGLATCGTAWAWGARRLLLCCKGTKVRAPCFPSSQATHCALLKSPGLCPNVV